MINSGILISGGQYIGKIVSSNDTDLFLGESIKIPMTTLLNTTIYRASISDMVDGLKLYLSLGGNQPIKLPKAYKCYQSAFRSHLPGVRILFGDYIFGDYETELDWYKSLSDDSKIQVIQLMDCEIEVNKLMGIITC